MPRLGEFSGVFLSGKLGYCEPQQMSLVCLYVSDISSVVTLTSFFPAGLDSDE